MTAPWIRPAEHLVFDGPFVVVHGRVCALLSKLIDLDKIRREVRGQNAQLDSELLAMRLAALKFVERTAAGTGQAPQPVPAAQSTQQFNSMLSATAAASLLGITDRAIRRAISEKRLVATKVDGRYRITNEDLQNFQATRTK